MMDAPLSQETQAALLLTAPLIVGRRTNEVRLLSLGEYRLIQKALASEGRTVADLLGPEASAIVRKLDPVVSWSRLESLLQRGFVLAQTAERWASRAIWVASEADWEYPVRLKARLGDEAPAVLYGCGEPRSLALGGLAIVGSRDASDQLLDYAAAVGQLASTGDVQVLSGGARGVDQAAMGGALESGGRAVGMMADSLEKVALQRDNRDLIMAGRLVLVSPFDPLAGFNVGNAMNRNKCIYALADVALIVNADYGRGGTWTGAIEQLERLRLVQTYVRGGAPTSRGLHGLMEKGALAWPEPESGQGIRELISRPFVRPESPSVSLLPLFAEGETESSPEPDKGPPVAASVPGFDEAQHECPPSAELFAKVRAFTQRMDRPMTEPAFAEWLGVTTGQARAWLTRLTEEGLVERLTKPTRYRPAAGQAALFEDGAGTE